MGLGIYRGRKKARPACGKQAAFDGMEVLFFF
jgi:hypothetical protein